jgi:hypothetical protein
MARKRINTRDVRYLSEVVPPSINALGRALRETFHCPADSFGAKGNEFHNYGYHRSTNWIRNSPDSRDRGQDYSIQGGLNQAADGNWIGAFDFTPGSWGSPRNRQLMSEITNRVYTAAKARDPRLANLYEFAGTLDGKHVITFKCADGSLKNPFDSTHLDHVHGSLWRSRAANDHTGILEVMIGVEDVPLSREQGNALAEAWAMIASLRDGVPVGPVDTHPGGPNWLVVKVNALMTATAQSAQREQDMLAALRALAQQAPDADTDVILARIDARTADVTGLIGQQSARIVELEQELELLRKEG